MRIIGGDFKGRKLFVPKGITVRPTADRVKEALFSILGGEVINAVVLDLFAGSGNLGLEALSRGAARAVFADKDSQSLAAVQRNIETLGVRLRVAVVRTDATKSMERLKSHGPFGLIFLDPPYGQGLAGRVLGNLATAGLVEPDALAVIEHGSRENVAGGAAAWELADSRTYGKTSLSFFRYTKAAC